MIINSVFFKNRASAFRVNDNFFFEYVPSDGGAIFANTSNITLLHNTFALNWAEEGDDISAWGGGTIKAHNNIFWSDYAYSQPVPPNALYASDYDDILSPFKSEGAPEFIFGVNIISGLATEGIAFGEQHVDQPPNFVDIANEDLTLDVCSYAIGRGNAAYLNGLSVDLLGNSRNQGGAPDLGAYETSYLGQSITDIVKEIKAADKLQFHSGEFSANFQDPFGPLQTIRINSLPEEGVLLLGNEYVTAGQHIPLNKIQNLNYKGDSCIASTSFKWSGASVNACTFANEAEVQITITDGIYIRPATPVITASSIEPLCYGDTLRLTGPEGFTFYRWHGNVIPSENDHEVLVTRPGLVQLEVFNHCLSEKSEIYEAVFKEMPPAPVAPDVRRCGPGTLTFEASGADSFIWYGDTSRQEIISTYSAFTDNYMESITYYVAGVTDCFIGPLAEVNGFIDKPPTGGAPIIKDTTLCDNGSYHGLLIRNHQEGMTYRLYVSEENGLVPYPYAQSFGGRVSFSLDSYNFSNQQQITLMVEAMSGACAGDMGEVRVSILPSPDLMVPVMTPENLKMCEGDSILFTAPEGYNHYLWQVSKENSRSEYQTSINQLYVKEFGRVTVGSFTENGCFSISIFNGEVGELQLESPSIALDPNGTLYAEAAVEGNYQWYLDGQLLASKTTDSLVAEETGIYQVKIVGNDGCSSGLSVPIEISIDQTPQCQFLQINAASTSAKCFGTATGSIELLISGGMPPYMVALSREDEQLFTSTTPDATTFENLKTGEYTATVTDDIGCSRQQSLSVAESQEEPLKVIATVDPTACFGTATGSVELLISGGVQPYGIALSQQDEVLYSLSTEDTGTFQSLGKGEYTATVTDNIGCTRQQNFEITEGQDQSLQVNATIHPTDCFGTATGRVDLTIEGGTLPYHVDLMRNDEPFFSETMTGAASVENLATGDYVLNVTDNVGCTWQQSLSLSAGQKAPLVCAYRISDQQQGIITLDCNGGAPPYSYAWDNDVAEGPVSGPLEDGSYAVTITDDLGCVTRLENMVLKKDGVVTSLPEDLNAAEYRVYPNPSAGKL